MRNIIQERPNTQLTGRLKKTFEFVDQKDIKNKVILDIGCGYGWFELNAFKKGAKKIFGAEVSENDLLTVKKYITDKKFTPIIGRSDHIPLKNNTIDTIVSWEVIEHIPKGTESKFFKEVARLLKKNGVFYLSTPHKATFSTYLDPAFWLIGHRHYSEKQLRGYARNNGFVVEAVDVTGGIWTSLAIVNMYIAKWVFRREKFFKTFFTAQENKEYQKKGFYNIFVKYRKK